MQIHKQQPKSGLPDTGTNIAFVLSIPGTRDFALKYRCVWLDAEALMSTSNNLRNFLLFKKKKAYSSNFFQNRPANHFWFPCFTKNVFNLACFISLETKFKSFCTIPKQFIPYDYDYCTKVLFGSVNFASFSSLENCDCLTAKKCVTI